MSVTGTSIDSCSSAVVTSAGFNLETNPLDVPGAASCGFGQPTDQDEVMNSGLDPTLADNGGPTMTHKLLPNSTAIDKGKSQPGETTDQRGAPRPSQFAFRATRPAAMAPTSALTRRPLRRPRSRASTRVRAAA